MTRVNEVQLDEDRIAQARCYVAALTGDPEAPVTFQTFPDHEQAMWGPQIFHGTLAEHWGALHTLNRYGHGIFVMVNEGDLLGRRRENFVALRAVFTDDDGKRDGPMPPSTTAPPSIVVQSKNGQHMYWLLARSEPLDLFTPMQEALAAHFGTDPRVKDLPRVMRLPGSFHVKDPANPYLVRVVATCGARYTVQQLRDAFRLHEPDEPPRPDVVVFRPALADERLRRARAYLSKVPGAVEGDNGDDATYRVACVLIRDFGLEIDEALIVFKEWNATCVPPWDVGDLEAKLLNAAKYATGEKGAKVNRPSTKLAGTEDICIVVPHERYYLRRPDGQWAFESPLHDKGARQHLRALGYSEITISKIVKHDLCPVLYGIDCDPSQGATFIRDDRLHGNTYRPPAILPLAGEYPVITAMINTVTNGDPEGAAWLLNWMAAKYQNPGGRSLTAPVFQGSQGIGKTKLGNIFAELLGADNTISISQPDLESAFNGHYASKLFVIADEVVNQDNLRDTAAILKKYVTDPTTIINVKGVPQYVVPNRMSFWFTSNAITPVRVEGDDDRRYTVFSAMRPPSPEYRAMIEGIHLPDGSYTPSFLTQMAAFAFALQEHCVDHALARTPLRNAARDALIAAGRNAAELFLAEIKARGVEEVLREFLPHSAHLARVEDGYRVGSLYSAYKAFTEDAGMRIAAKERFGQEMRRFFPEAERVRAKRSPRPYVYVGLPEVGDESQ